MFRDNFEKIMGMDGRTQHDVFSYLLEDLENRKKNRGTTSNVPNISNVHGATSANNSAPVTSHARNNTNRQKSNTVRGESSSSQAAKNNTSRTLSKYSEYMEVDVNTNITIEEVTPHNQADKTPHGPKIYDLNGRLISDLTYEEIDLETALTVEEVNSPPIAHDTYREPTIESMDVISHTNLETLELSSVLQAHLNNQQNYAVEDSLQMAIDDQSPVDQILLDNANLAINNNLEIDPEDSNGFPFIDELYQGSLTNQQPPNTAQIDNFLSHESSQAMSDFDINQLIEDNIPTAEKLNNTNIPNNTNRNDRIVEVEEKSTSESASVSQVIASTVKRGRGRPRKNDQTNNDMRSYLFGYRYGSKNKSMPENLDTYNLEKVKEGYRAGKKRYEADQNSDDSYNDPASSQSDYSNEETSNEESSLSMSESSEDESSVSQNLPMGSHFVDETPTDLTSAMPNQRNNNNNNAVDLNPPAAGRAFTFFDETPGYLYNQGSISSTEVKKKSSHTTFHFKIKINNQSFFTNRNQAIELQTSANPELGRPGRKRRQPRK